MPYPLSRNNITEPKAKSGRTPGLDYGSIVPSKSIFRFSGIEKNMQKTFFQFRVLTFRYLLAYAQGQQNGFWIGEVNTYIHDSCIYV